jgi:predicted ATPase/serine phosphatase RsbU (regulator of sigma subunit)
MKRILGCHIREMLYEGKNSIVYRGMQEGGTGSVIIKILKGDHPGLAEIAGFKREYEILRKTELDGVIKVMQWGSVDNSYAMIMEDFGGDSVKQIVGKRSISVKEFIVLFLQCAKILKQLHDARIIHLNVNPSNFVWNSKDGQLKMIDFGLATEVWGERASFKDPRVLEGTLDYISPEQTGRMNRAVDYRSDLYSLGVMFYELMTGHLPFQAQDAMEIIHCHIAKIPVPPHHIDTVLELVKPEGLEILSKIILKLLSKNAEERYLSSSGLIHDLVKCLEYFNERQTLSGFDFELGKRDVSDIFQIPQKLYGRETEIQQLVDTFDRICSPVQEGLPTETLIVKGTAGIGKSALVNEIHKHLAEKRGYFISGKFDRFNTTPYLALIQAFQDLVRQILTEPDEHINKWKVKILEALGPNGQVIIDVIPEVGLIIGEQPQVPELPPNETQNRFNTYFKNFIGTFAQAQHPLAIFLDDLQWTDISTLKFLETLILDFTTNYLLIIGAYRDSEVDSSHPLTALFENLKRKNSVVNFINLRPLEINHINNLLSESLNSDPPDIGDLSGLFLEKTNGNPFFLRQFLNSLVQENLIEFDTSTLRWTWDLKSIIKKDITSNVAELLVNKIMGLPERPKRIIQLAACIGTRFDLGTLSIINERSVIETESELREVLDAGLIQPVDEGYRDVANLQFLKTLDTFDKLEFKIQYLFLHDRIHQAAYSLIGEENKRIHHQIGNLLIEKLDESERDEKIFDIVNHLNSAIDLIKDQKAREELATLNYKAGNKAKSATAYEVAHKYFLIGISLLNESSWENQYSLTLGMYTATAEVSCLIGQFELMDDLSKTTLKRARGLLDLVKIYEIIIQSFMARARLREGVVAAIEILKQLGVNIPQNPRKITVLFKLLRLRFRLARVTLEELEALPQMSDPQKLAAMRILMNAASATYYGNVLVSITIALKMVHLSVRYGNAPCSPYGFGMYGIVLAGVAGDISKGYQFGRFSTELINKLRSKEYYARINVLYHIFIKHWKDKISETVQPLNEAYFRGIETGDYEYSSYCAAYSCIHSMLSGTNLDTVDCEMRKNIDIVNKLNQEIMLYILKIISQVSLNLSGKSENRIALIGEQFNEEEDVPQIIEDNVITFLGILYTMKSLLCYLFEEPAKALQNIDEAEKYKDTLIGLYYLPLLNFYSSLTYLSCYNDVSWSKRKTYMGRILMNQKRLRKYARFAPDNHRHKYLLVEAERARIRNKDTKAMKNYDQAIALAKTNGFIQEEALSNELAAKYFLEKGNERIAKTYMKEAHYLYTRWGAKAKTDQLRENYPDLINDVHDNGGIVDGSSELSGDLIHSRLDMGSVQKASQILSEEIHLDKLLEKLLKIMITNSGARKGTIILSYKEGLFIEGEATADNDQVTVLQHLPVNEYNNIARVIINYVYRTKQTIVLDDAATNGEFLNDTYIEKNQSKSLFCTPLISKTEINGILYLENNLVAGSFTPQRTEILKTLAGQFIISIENARLYKNLEEYNKLLELRVKERTMKLKEMNRSMTNSIDYASKIQNAILTPDEVLAQLLTEYFVLYKPLEIVSGDFYWVTQKGGETIIAVGDCTGHGVPGAFMSILGVALLNDIVNKNETLEAASILNQLRDQVIVSLHQTGKEDETREGMDIALCVLNKDQMSLQYAGAHHPLFLLRNGKLIETKADMMTIGITSESNKFFTNHTLNLQKNDMIYLFSDGYADQIGGEGRKRFKLTRLKQQLINLQDLIIQDQKSALDGALNEWMGLTGQHGEEYEQIDDIVILGFRLS